MRTLFRQHPVMRAIADHMRENTCGELCSIRFTWQRPHSRATDQETFLFDILASAIDAVQDATACNATRLILKQAGKTNNVMGFAEYANGVVAEFEFNECLPNSMPDILFVKANFTHGHITNQPIVGFFNEEGMILADDEHLTQPIAERDTTVAQTTIEQLFLRYAELGEDVDGSILCQKIREALK